MANDEKHIYVKLASYDNNGQETTTSDGRSAGNTTTELKDNVHNKAVLSQPTVVPILGTIGSPETVAGNSGTKTNPAADMRYITTENATLIVQLVAATAADIVVTATPLADNLGALGGTELELIATTTLTTTGDQVHVDLGAFTDFSYAPYWKFVFTNDGAATTANDGTVIAYVVGRNNS